MTNREKFNEYIHRQVAWYEALSNEALMGLTLYFDWYFDVLREYVLSCGADPYDAGLMLEWLKDEAAE